MRIGAKIQAMRKAAKLTQNDLAEKMGVSFQTVSGWERDEYLPDTNRLSELAYALNTSVAALVREDDVPAWELHDRLFSEEHMYTFVKASTASRGYYQSSLALSFAAEKHEGQYRKGADHVPYINHPLTMACHALAMNLNDDVVAAILLHDVCEDCGVSPEELPVSDTVQNAVRLLSFSVKEGESKADAKARYFNAISENRVASIVKVIDRCNNLSTMATGFTRAKMIEYIDETEKYVLPLIEQIKNSWPEFYNAAFLLKYQICSIIETLKRTLV